MAKKIATNGQTDLWLLGSEEDGDICRAPSNSPLNAGGRPTDRRWECGYKTYLRYRYSVFKAFEDIKMFEDVKSSEGIKDTKQEDRS